MPTPHRYDPVEVIEGAVPFRLSQVAWAIAAAAAIMLLFGARPLLDWSNALPISRLSDAILAIAALWSDLSDTLGLNVIFDHAQEWFRRFQALGF